MTQHPTHPSRLADWRAALLVVLGVTAARLLYLALWCPYALVEDEAYYWLWSRHLDFSYLTKGPGVALTIALGTLIAGDTELGVRLIAPLWGAVLCLGVAGAAGELAPESRRGAARLWAAALALLSPPMQATSLLMTIDGPMLAFWALGAWASIRALARGGTWSWLGLGAAIGLGMLFKPTIGLLLLVPLVGVPGRAWGWRCDVVPRWGPWGVGAIALALLGLAPLVIWNALHDWALIHHLQEHLRAESTGASDPVSPVRRAGWIGEYLGLQALLGGPALALGLAAAFRLRRFEPSINPCALAALVAASLPVYLLYFVVSFFTRIEGNWALGGLVPLLAAGGAAAGVATDPRPGRARARGAGEPGGRPPGLWIHLARASVAIGVVTGLGGLRLDLLARLVPSARLIPIGRLTTAPRIAASAERLAESLDAGAGPGSEDAAILLTDHYGLSAQLAFYAPQRRVGCWSGSRTARVTQFDLWPDTRLDDPTVGGRAAVIIGGRGEDWRRVFDRVEEIDPFEVDHRKRRVYVGHGFHAPPAAPRVTSDGVADGLPAHGATGDGGGEGAP